MPIKGTIIHRVTNLAREDWLFIGYPYYRKPYPKWKEQTFVRLYTLTTPSESISLVEPNWDIWQPAQEMDQWFRSLYPPAGRWTGGALSSKAANSAL